MAVNAFVQTYRFPALAPEFTPSYLARDQWDDYPSRLFRYGHYGLFYHNMAFTALETYRAQHLSERGLYRFTRPIYNPVFRLVELEAAKAYGGALDWEDFSEGAMPLVGATPAIRDAVRQLCKWSNWGAYKSLYGRNLARFGDGVLYVATDLPAAKVRIEVLHPALIAELKTNAVGHAEFVAIEYDRQDDPQAPPWRYRMEIDKGSFRTFRDGEPAAIHTDAAGRQVAEWDNPYGFVPIATAKSLDIGQVFGATSFHATLPKIEEACDLASILHDQIRKAITAPWYLAGVRDLKELREQTATAGESDEAERNSVPVILGPEGSRAEQMIAHLDIPGAVQALERTLEEIEDEIPQLSLNRLRRSGGDLTYPGITTAYDDAISRIQEFRGNADAALLRALQMGISIGAAHRFEDFQGFTLDSYRQGALDFRIDERPVIRQALSTKEEIELLIQADAPSEWVWKKLGYEDAEIAAALTQQVAATRQVAAQLISVMAGQEARDNAGA